MVARRTSSQHRFSSDSPYRQHRTHIPTPSDGSTKEEKSTLANNVAFHTTSSPSKMRYCVIFPLSKFVMFFWAKHIYGKFMLYMSLGLTVLTLIFCLGHKSIQVCKLHERRPSTAQKNIVSGFQASKRGEITLSTAQIHL
jgi:hypothetical protein